MSCFFGLLIAIFSRSLFNVFYIHLALACSNWIKTCLDSSSRILESCPLISFWHFCWYFEQVHVKWVKSAVRLCFVVLACLRSSWGQHYSVLALNTVHSPILVFTPIMHCRFEQFLPNISSFDQSTVSSSLRKLVKPKKSDKHSRSFVWKLISKPSCVLVVFICANKNKQYICI